MTKEARAIAANEIDNVVQQLMAIDGPCSCESRLCQHWRLSAGIIIAGMLSDREVDAAAEQNK